MIGPGLKTYIRANRIGDKAMVFQSTHLRFSDAISASGPLTLGPGRRFIWREAEVYTKGLNRIGKMMRGFSIYPFSLKNNVLAGLDQNLGKVGF